MGLFDKKPKVEMESFCKDYYDSLFPSLVNGEKPVQKGFDVGFQTLKDKEPLFSKVDYVLFEVEITAMHLELFALAFFKRFPDINKAYRQSAFTQHYLQYRNRSNIWEAMGEYGKAVAQSATTNSNGQMMTADTAIGRMTITRVNEFRFGIFKKLMKQYSVDRDNLNEEEKIIANCIARVCNRIASDINRNNQVCNRLVSGLFLQRLGAETICGKNWEPSKEFLLSLALLPFSMYQFSHNALKGVELQFL